VNGTKYIKSIIPRAVERITSTCISFL